MSWQNPPTKIIEARDRMLECATVQAILTGLSTPAQQARFHYPEADPTTDVLPLFVLEREDQEFEKLTATGSTGSGTISWALFVEDSVSTGTIDGYIDIAQELDELTTEGLYVIRSTVQRASRPTPGMQAGDDGGQIEIGKAFACVIGSMTWEG